MYEKDGWRIFTPRHAPRSDDIPGHLTFALKYEGVDLAVLKKLFIKIGPDEIKAWVMEAGTSAYARRIWFFYEWLLNETLGLRPASSKLPYVPAVDPDMQWTAEKEKFSPMQKVKNNLPGTPSFCPMIFLTEKLRAFSDRGLADRAKSVIAEIPPDRMARAAAFLLLKDSKSSFVIEGEDPPQNRIQRWGRAVASAGEYTIELHELLRLQKIVIGDARFVKLGLRQSGGFVGMHDRDSGAPLPDHISARHEDLPRLIEGLTAFDEKTRDDPGLDPILTAAALAFGFVYIHPFEDGNGRIHRYIIHHVLSERGFTPPGIVFPISAAMLDRIKDYRKTLETYSRGLLPLIQWESTREGNVHVLNETADFYRYFDATPQAEFLYECVAQTIEIDVPAEAKFLHGYDTFKNGIADIIDMPERISDMLFRFLQQNNGELSKRARKKEFAMLTDEEVAEIETAYRDIFSEALS